jgi:hypothetical protein
MILLVSTWLVGYFQGGSYSRNQTQNKHQVRRAPADTEVVELGCSFPDPRDAGLLYGVDPSKEAAVEDNGELRREITPPLVVVAIGALLIGVAYVVDQIPGPIHEWSLTIGAPSILIVLGGLIWLAVSLIWYFVSRTITRRRGGS